MKRLLFLLSSLSGPGAAMVATGYRGHGFVGYGITMYQAPCAYACHDSLSELVLSCSVVTGDASDMGSAYIETSPECYAADDVFLGSLAYCIHSHCPDVPVADLERFWFTYMIGRKPGQPLPKVSYTEAFLKLNGTTPAAATTDGKLLEVSLVDEETYLANYNADWVFQAMDIEHERYGLVLLLGGAAIPIGLSLMRFVPFPKLWVSKFNAWFIYPAAFGHHHRAPLLNIGLVPTRGQALFIAYLIVINVVLSAVGFRTITPNSFYATPTIELLYYISNRVGILAFANTALLILYAGRNNVLLWVTNWSHSTFLLLHRWLAVIAILQACLHSAIFLQIYVANEKHSSESTLPYWYWGIIATLALTFQLPTSILPLREKFYETFLACHFAFALLALVGCYLHIYERFANQWGYETWIYIAFGFWTFDRLMRVLRSARNGVRTAHVTVLDENYVRLEVPGATGAGHVYLHFPTLSCLPSANTAPLQAAHISPDSKKESSLVQGSARVYSSTGEAAKAKVRTGLTFFVRTRSGTTLRLRNATKLPVLVESSYGSSVLYNRRDELATASNIVLIAGGVGITAVAPLAREHEGRVRLYWSVKSEALVDAVTAILDQGLLRPGAVGEIAVGRRLDIRTILESEITDSQEGVTAVVVCGPRGMADEVRSVVSALGRQRTAAVMFLDEAFGW